MTHKKLSGKTEQRQGLIQVTVGDGEQLDRVFPRGVVDEHVVEGKTVVVAADKPAAHRRQAHDKGRQGDEQERFDPVRSCRWIVGVFDQTVSRSLVRFVDREYRVNRAGRKAGHCVPPHRRTQSGPATSTMTQLNR